jgi:hypothetical protein
MAVAAFKGLGWFLCGVVVAPACYMVTSQGAAERQRLHMIEGRIAAANKDIRGLETEFQTRANLAQIGRWNGDVLALQAPAPQQFLASESQLADLDSAMTDEPQVASLVVPAGAPKLEPQPAVEIRGATATAQNGNGGVSKVANRAVAMLDTRLLSASTIGDLERMAATEKLKLR